MTPIGIFVATRWERQAVLHALPAGEDRLVAGTRCTVVRRPQDEWWIVPMGVGPTRAAETVRAVCGEQRFTLMVSTGFACALQKADIGDVLLGTEVVMEKDGAAGPTIYCTPELVERMTDVLRREGLAVLPGRFVTVPNVLCRAADKRAVAQRQSAVGLDMESAALGAAAREQGIPFAIVRTVSDLLEEDLPLDFNLFLRPSGWMSGVVSCLAHPSSLIGLNRLRVQSRRAGERLTQSIHALAAAPLEAESVTS